MENLNNTEKTSENAEKELRISDVRVSCPKCGGDWVGDIGYDVWQCFDCDETWKQKSKTGLESN